MRKPPGGFRRTCRRWLLPGQSSSPRRRRRREVAPQKGASLDRGEEWAVSSAVVQQYLSAMPVLPGVRPTADVFGSSVRPRRPSSHPSGGKTEADVKRGYPAAGRNARRKWMHSGSIKKGDTAGVISKKQFPRKSQFPYSTLLRFEDVDCETSLEILVWKFNP
jgi:hypothetical protein